jgi:hypothetical protein
MEKGISPALKNLSKICAVLSVLVVIYPFVFLIKDADFSSSYAITTAHTHLAGNTLLLFMVGFLFTFTRFNKAKIIWPLISAAALLLAMSVIFFEMLTLVIPGYLIFALSLLVMAVGILIKNS